MNPFEYAIPKTVGEVFQQLQPEHSAIKAGGIDLLDLMKERILSPQRLVNIRNLPELKFLKTENGRLGLGPNLTLGELSEEASLQVPGYQALAQSASSAATPQIRNVATLGGNLCQRPRCWYFRSQDFPCLRKGGTHCYAIDGENQYHAIFENKYGCVIVHPSATAIALIALGASIEITNAKESREIPLESFFISPSENVTRENVLEGGELITKISLPATTANSRSFYFKQKAKQSFDWPIAEVAVHLTMDGSVCRDSKIMLGAAAPIPWRAKEAEAVLKGQTLTKELARKAAEATMEKAQPLSQNGYKINIFKAIITRTICWAAGINPLE